MNEDKPQTASKWTTTLNNLRGQIKDEAQLALLARDDWRCDKLFDQEQPAKDDHPSWKETINRALRLGYEPIVDFVVQSCKDLGVNLKHLVVMDGKARISPFQMWKCVSELGIETLSIYDSKLISDGRKSDLAKCVVTSLEINNSVLVEHQICDEISRIKGLKTVAFINTRTLPEEKFPKLFDLVPRLESLDVEPTEDGNCFGTLIPKSIGKNTTLKRLRISRPNRADLLEILHALKLNTKLEALSIKFRNSDHHDHDEEIALSRSISSALAEFITHNPALRELEVIMLNDRDRDHDEDHENTIARPITLAVGAHKNIEKFAIYCPLANKILQPLIGHKSLQVLELGGKGRRIYDAISQQAFGDLLTLIKTTPKLREISLPRCDGLQTGVPEALLKAFTNAKNLKKVDLRSGVLHSDGLNDLIEGLAANTSIQELELPNSNEIVLGPQFSSNTSLVSVTVSGGQTKSAFHLAHDGLEYEEPGPFVPWNVSFDFLNSIDDIVWFNKLLANPEYVAEITRAYQAFARAGGAGADEGVQIMRHVDAVRHGNLQITKASVHLRELNRDAAGLPPRSPWKLKLDEIFHAIPGFRLQRYESNGIDLTPFRRPDRPEMNDLQGWGALIAAAVTTSEPKLLDHVLQQPLPALSALTVGAVPTPNPRRSWVSPDPQCLRAALKALPIEILTLRYCALTKPWFEQLDYFSSDKIRYLIFKDCFAYDEPFAELIQKLKTSLPVGLMFTSFRFPLPTQDIFQSVSKSKLVEQLNYQSTWLSPGCLSTLSQSKHLRHLCLPGPMLKGVAQELGQLLKDWRLDSLTLSGENLTNEHVAHWAKGLKTSQNLKSVYLSNNYFSVEQEQLLIEALLANKSIEKIYAWPSYWHDEQHKQAVAGLGKRLVLPNPAAKPGLPAVKN